MSLRSAKSEECITFGTAPVAVTVNGGTAEVLYAGGYPGSVDSYQINFRMPTGLPAGMASLQISAARIGGPSVLLAVQ